MMIGRLNDFPFKSPVSVSSRAWHTGGHIKSVSWKYTITFLRSYTSICATLSDGNNKKA